MLAAREQQPEPAIVPPSPAEFVDRLPEAFREWLAGRRIEEVECVISDIAGISRGKAMPFAKFMREDRMFLPTSVFHQTIAGDYVDMEIANQWTESGHGAEARLRRRRPPAPGPTTSRCR